MNHLSSISRAMKKLQIPPEIMKYVAGNFKIKTCYNEEIVLRQQEYWNSLIIVEKGLLRFYYELDKGTEINKYFLVESECIAPIWNESSSFNFSLASIGESKIIIFNLDVFYSLCKRVSVYENNVYDHFQIQLLKRIVVKKIDSEMMQLTMNATQRYQHVLNTMPDIVKLVPQYQLASYLGITPVSLSRIKRQFRG